MKSYYKYFSFILLSFLLMSFYSITSYAADGFEGFAIHRDGAFLGTTWHAGLMDEANPTINLSVIHAGQSNNTIIYANWEDFLNGNTFKGFYYPTSGVPNSTTRDNIKIMARRVKDEGLMYTPLQQINYTITSGTKVEPSILTHCRCDGLVEYCYEYYNLRIYGDNLYWNITKMGSSYKSHHAGANVTPKKQAEDYMTKWMPAGKDLNIVNQKSGKSMDVCGPSSANGAIIQQWSYEGLSNQKFHLQHTNTSGNDYYSFRPLNAFSSAIEVENNSNVNGTEVQIWAIPSTGFLNSQKFRLVQNSDGSYKITTYGSGYSKVIEVASGNMNNGAPVKLYSDNGTEAQHWFFVPT